MKRRATMNDGERLRLRSRSRRRAGKEQTHARQVWSETDTGTGRLYGLQVWYDTGDGELLVQASGRDGEGTGMMG